MICRPFFASLFVNPSWCTRAIRAARQKKATDSWFSSCSILSFFCADLPSKTTGYVLFAASTKPVHLSVPGAWKIKDRPTELITLTQIGKDIQIEARRNGFLPMCFERTAMK